MPRKPRIEFSGALYHVIARGNQRKKVFLDSADYSDYLNRVFRYHKKFGFILYCYCLMPNHVHLLIETGDAPLSKIMHSIQFSYTQSFNMRHDKIGHLFQGRYKAILCDKDEYLLQLIAYINNNPVRAKMVVHPENYIWSSHRSILGLEKNIICCDLDKALMQFGSKRKIAIKNYKKYILDAARVKHKDEYYQLKDQRVLGEDDFATSVLLEKKHNPDIYYDVPIRELVKIVSREFDISPNNILSLGKERSGSLGREIVVYVGRNIAGKTIRAMANELSRVETAMSIRYQAFEEKLAKDLQMKKQIERIFSFIKANYPIKY